MSDDWEKIKIKIWKFWENLNSPRFFLCVLKDVRFASYKERGNNMTFFKF